MRWLYNGILSIVYGVVLFFKLFYVYTHNGFTWIYNQISKMFGWNRAFYKAEDPIPDDSPLRKVINFFSFGKSSMNTDYQTLYKEAQGQSDRNFARYKKRKAQSDKNFARYQREKERAELAEKEIKRLRAEIIQLNAKTGQPQKGNSTTQHQADSRTSLAILGLKTGFTPQDLKEAYTRLVSRYHPDKHVHMSTVFVSEAEAEFQKIRAAYDKLK